MAVHALITIHGQPTAVLAFVVAGDRIVVIEGIREPDRVRRLAATVLAGPAAVPVPVPTVTSEARSGSEK